MASRSASARARAGGARGAAPRGRAARRRQAGGPGRRSSSSPAPLDREEWAFIREHTVIGERILAAAPALARWRAIVRATPRALGRHGLPGRARRREIPLAARIIAVCDASPPMTSRRAPTACRSPVSRRSRSSPRRHAVRPGRRRGVQCDRRAGRQGAAARRRLAASDQLAEPPVGFGRAAQPDDVPALEPPGPGPTPPMVRSHGERAQRPPPAPGFEVPGIPELDAIAPPPPRAPVDPRQQRPQRQVQPNDRVGLVDQPRAQLAHVVAVGDPAVQAGERFFDARPKLLGGRLLPIWAVMQRVELDVRNAEGLARRAARVVFPEQEEPITAIRGPTGDYRTGVLRRTLLAVWVLLSRLRRRPQPPGRRSRDCRRPSIVSTSSPSPAMRRRAATTLASTGSSRSSRRPAARCTCAPCGARPSCSTW